MKTILIICLSVITFCFVHAVQAGVVKPYTFSAGTSASASQVNANFDTIYNAVNQGLGGVPTGGIIMWSGSVASIPSGWVLCDGSNGTPNLSNRFIVGAGSGMSTGATGGSNTLNLSHSHTVNNHSHSVSLNTNTTGNHSHTYSGTTGNESKEKRMEDGDGHHIADNHNHHYSGTTSTSGNHNHSVSGNTGGAAPRTNSQLSTVDNRPAYYALAFIMKQ